MNAKNQHLVIRANRWQAGNETDTWKGIVMIDEKTEVKVNRVSKVNGFTGLRIYY